jgi:hypothetical protein
MVNLPSIADLIQRTKALAALDLVLSPEWQYRYYSFNSAWSSSERMASMRDGCGNEWWMVFHESGWAALKGLGHETPAWSKGREAISKAIQKQFPSELRDFANEPAFRWDSTSFGYFHLPTSGGWSYANLTTPFSSLDSGDAELLRHLVGGADDYALFATVYYETDVPVDVVESVFSLQPITQAALNKLNPEAKLDKVSQELFTEIGYPR